MDGPDQSTFLLLGQIDGKLTALVESFGQHREATDRRFEKHEVTHEDHDKRLSALERFRWLAVGLASIAASAVGAVFTAFLGSILK
ncbi:hypothetical protein DMC25_27085 [Caulobacter sp. D4A]|uniref:hypothetical protein n=1 Tax=unclassified Caulobacter TaxID=2648921 RepID=UPI000D73B591|nr:MULTISPECIES: hypothetical protein [unclassified Caulobacter]PXA70416.1 hypothetical protein DMC25_27085 [Caulobacter sp. D4A]PXA96811.1 hypothetical protein DMC18_00680 [Caulobacter sp. D5]